MSRYRTLTQSPATATTAPKQPHNLPWSTPPPSSPAKPGERARARPLQKQFDLKVHATSTQAAKPAAYCTFEGTALVRLPVSERGQNWRKSGYGDGGSLGYFVPCF